MAYEALPNLLPSDLSNVMSYHSVCQPHWNSCCSFDAPSKLLRAFVLPIPSYLSEIHIVGALISFRSLSNVTLLESSPLTLDLKEGPLIAPYSPSLLFWFSYSTYYHLT